MVIALAAAYLAEDIDIRQEVHLNAPLTFTLASLATPATHIKRKASRFVATLARLRQHGIKITNCREYSRVGRGIRARSASNRRLINADHLVHMLHSSYRFMSPGLFTRAIELAGKRSVKDVIH